MENFEMIRRIGSGFNAWVELARDKKTGELVAVKVFHNVHTSPFQTNNIFINEKLMLQKLERCQGIVRLLSWSQSQQFQLTMQHAPQPKYLVLQYYQNGDLLQYIKNKNPFKEAHCRRLFSQLVESIDQQVYEVITNVHKMGIVHRDIKLENILIGDDYQLCVADLGFACQGYDEKGRQKKLTDFLGSIAYIAPEMFLGNPYSGVSTDVFQLGVCLFLLSFGNLPFQRAHPKDDNLYKYIAKDKWSQFWEYHDSKKHSQTKSPELKDLLMGMLNLSHRINLQQVRDHPWFEMEWSSLTQLKDEMIQRKISPVHSPKASQFEERKK